MGQTSFLNAVEDSLHQVETIQMLGVHIHQLTVNKLFEIMEYIIRNHRKALIANVNVYAMSLAHEIPWFRKFLNSSDFVFCDGAGVMLGALILGYRLPQRITYADWTWQLAEFAAPHSFTFFFLGANPGIADKAAVRLKERYPDLQIVGVHHGYFDKTTGSAENEAVIEQINAVNPNILIIGFGMPLQERWLMENWERIEANVALTGGAVFDYISGELCRGPRLLTDHGFEWLARLLIEPRRLWKRYLLGNPLFLWQVLKQRLELLRFDDQ